jgi:hypothetical protein
MEGDASSRTAVMAEAVAVTRALIPSQDLGIMSKVNQLDRLPGMIMLVIVIRTTLEMVEALGTPVVLETSTEDLDMVSMLVVSIIGTIARALIINGINRLLEDTEEWLLGTMQGLMALVERGA